MRNSKCLAFSWISISLSLWLFKLLEHVAMNTSHLFLCSSFENCSGHDQIIKVQYKLLLLPEKMYIFWDKKLY